MESGRARKASFEAFVGDMEKGLRHALIALFGHEDGRDAAAQALLYAWEHWENLQGMDNPAGYVFRVGQNWGRRNARRRSVSFPSPSQGGEPWVEPSLAPALRDLPDKQRVAVVLRHGSDWSYGRIAGFMGTTEAAVRKNVERGLVRLRSSMEVQVDS